jgi:type I restriction enzyme R subunit
VLQQQLENPNVRIIITTIQKLSKFIAKNKIHAAYKGRFVLIFDECHRSQFGDMHSQVKKHFSNYNMFGFTGTPIFAENAGTSGNPLVRTTEQAFGDKLHTYTIVDAISDKNVLPFRIDYVNTIEKKDGVSDVKVRAIDTEKVLLAPERISMIVEYIREHFAQKTKRNQSYNHNARRVAGFNSIFATASIDAAKRYYAEFVRQQAHLPESQRIKVGLIYSFAANEDIEQGGLLPEEEFEVDGLDASSRDFLDSAIQGFNSIFGSNWDSSADKFQGYYQDLSRRLKQREIDIVIVVNMFLTGFDATTLNTLWVDKNLRQHGLLQAYSRTNRILNSVKAYGNIVSFRDLEEATNDAISLFGNKEAGGIVLLKSFGEYFAKYEEFLTALTAEFAPGQLITGESAEKRFVETWGALLRLRNILQAFDEFGEQDTLTPYDAQEYQSTYLEIYARVRANEDSEKESILIKQVEINVDYILMLVRKYQEKNGGVPANRELREEVMRAVESSYSLRSKKDLIEIFINNLTLVGDVDSSWRDFIESQKELELEKIILDENLKPTETREFVTQAFRDGAVQTAGTAIAGILPPISKFSPTGENAAKKQKVIDRLVNFLDRFLGIG